LSHPISVQRVIAGELSINVAVVGEGPAVLLLHGFPHTWELWAKIIPDLAKTHTVVAPDLRGLGGTTRAPSGYDAQTIADDAVALLDALSLARASVVAIDLGVPPAFMLAMTHPDRVERLVLMESLVGPLPGAESFGAPWWFGFHAVPGLPEHVLEGHEAQYLDFFLSSGTMGRGVEPAFRDAVIRGYSGTESLHTAFEHYRAFPVNAQQILAVTRVGRLRMPTMTIGAFPVGDATYHQLKPFADDLVGNVLDGCGHIIPQDQPDALVDLLTPFLP